MRTTLDIDDRLMASALKSGDYRTKKSTIEAGLRLLVQVSSQQKLRHLRGKVVWDADLCAMRED